MRAYAYRDESGCWMAHIEEQAGSPDNRAVGAVFRRQPLNIPQSCTREEAEHALRLLMSREARCRNGHR